MAEVAEPVKTVLGLVLLLAIVAALYFFFGNPTCDALANSTASNLQLSINKVTNPDFPNWNNLDDIPSDNRYYESALVRLCQQPPTRSEFGDLVLTLSTSFFGGIPQYQLYYEHFPEMQSFPLIWNEAYPWGGGAGQTAAFWFGMRGLSFARKAVQTIVGSKIIALGKVMAYSKHLAQRGGNAILNSVKRLSVEADYAGALAKAESFIEKEWGKAAAKSITYSRVLNFRATQDALVAFEGEGFLIRSLDKEANIVMDGTDRLIVNSKEVPVKISFVDKSGQELDKYLFVKRNALGEVEEMRLKDGPAWSSPDYELATIKPSDLLKEARKLNSKDGEFLDSFFVSADDVVDPNTGKKVADLTEDELEKFFASNKNLISKTKFFQNYFRPVVNRFEKTVQKFKTAGYDVDRTFMRPEETKAFGRSLNKFLQEGENYEKFVKPTIGITEGAKARIMKAFDLASPQQINRQFTSKYITEVMNSIDGVAFVPRDSKLAIYRQAMEIYPTFSKTEAVRKFPTLGEQLLHNMRADPDYAKLLKNGAIQESEVIRIAKSIESLSPDDPKYKELVYDMYFKTEMNLAVDATEAQQKSLGKELNLLIGFMEQNPKAATVTSPRIVVGREIATAEGKKLVYLHGTALINPVSFVHRGFALSEFTQGCEYNSLCVYSHATQLENPFFLSEDSDKFTVRSWRPVNPLYYIGIQAALMHVPPHPTFYLVGPCIGQAKIWKVKSYDGQPTVFVSVDKFDSGDAASNYCYADIDLVNAYTAIWDASDAATIATAVFSGGTTVIAKAGTLTSKAAAAASKGVSKTSKTLFNNADPISLAQAGAEAAISWPGYPWKELGFEQMRDIVAKEGFEKK